MNKISYWFPKIKDCGIKVPETLIFQVPEDIIETFYCENYEDDLKIYMNMAKNKVIMRKNKVEGFQFNILMSNS